MFRGETWFQLGVCINSQTNRFSVLIHKLLVHVVDDGKWYAMAATNITVPIFSAVMSLHHVTQFSEHLIHY
jgi:hypothetical protein